MQTFNTALKSSSCSVFRMAILSNSSARERATSSISGMFPFGSINTLVYSQNLSNPMVMPGLLWMVSALHTLIGDTFRLPCSGLLSLIGTNELDNSGISGKGVFTRFHSSPISGY